MVAQPLVSLSTAACKPQVHSEELSALWTVGHLLSC